MDSRRGAAESSLAPLTEDMLVNVIETIAGTPQIRDRCMDWHRCEGRCFTEDVETCAIRAEVREWGIRTADERPPLPETVSHLFLPRPPRS